MSKIKTLGLALIAVFAFGVVAASSASAAPEWGLCKEVAAGTGKYEDKACMTAKTEGNFEFEKLTSEVLVNSHGTLDLEDTKATGGASKIECVGTDHGLVGAGSKDLLDFVLATSCKKIDGNCNEGTVFMKWVNLPWKTLLLTVGTEIRDDLENDGKGEPGYSIECGATIFKLKVEDTCTGATSTGILAIAGGVEATFESKSQHGNCTIGGTGTGVITGTDLMLSPAGHNLAIGAGNGETDEASLAPSELKFEKILGQELSLTLEDRGTETVEIASQKLTGAEAGDYEITDLKKCLKTLLKTKENCAITIKLKSTTASKAEYEAELKYGDGVKEIVKRALKD